MKIQKKLLIGLCAGALMCVPAAAFAAPPPPSPGMMPAPGQAACPRCGGSGHVSSGLFGMHQKRCPDCQGSGVCAPRHRRHAEPAPQPQAGAQPRHEKSRRSGPGPR